MSIKLFLILAICTLVIAWLIDNMFGGGGNSSSGHTSKDLYDFSHGLKKYADKY